MGQDESRASPASQSTDHSIPSSKSTEIASTSLFSVLVGIWSAHDCSEVDENSDPWLISVDTSVFTTFYFGVLTNRDEVLAGRDYPNFQFLFRSSWGLSRRDLGIYNHLLRNGVWSHKPYDRDDPAKRVGLRPDFLLTLVRDSTASHGRTASHHRFHHRQSC